MTNAEKRLKNYLDSLNLEEQEIIGINELSITTRISKATISRYARSQGYKNFADMKTNFNNKVKDKKTGNWFNKSLSEIKDLNLRIITDVDNPLIGDMVNKHLLMKGYKSKYFPRNKFRFIKTNDIILAINIDEEFNNFDYLKTLKNKVFIIANYKMKFKNDWTVIKVFNNEKNNNPFISKINGLKMIFNWIYDSVKS